MKYDGFRRGGAPIALAPEITLPRPGPAAGANGADGRFRTADIPSVGSSA